MGGLSFLNAGLLFFAAATVLPLLIWLLAKRKPKRVVFSSLRFIKASEQEEKKRTRLKNILLLIIRMLIILLTALAVSRPLWQFKRLKPARNHPPTAIAILLDTSYSMDYVFEAKSSLDRAKEAVRQVNSLCTPQDRLILVSSDQNWNRLHAQIYAGRIPEDLLARVAATYSPLSLQAMAELAQAKLRDTQLANRELYLFTDGQRQEYPAKTAEKLYVIDVSGSGEHENLSCSGAGVLPQLVEKTRRQSIRFQLSNHGRTDRRDVLVKVVLGGAKAAEKFVDLPARQSVNQTIAVDLREDGWQSGYVEVMDDRLSQDNRSWFAFPFNLDPNLAVITAQAQLPPYLQTLLRVYAGNQGRISTIPPAQVSLATLDQYQSFVFWAPGPLSPKLREFAGALQKSGRGALFCLDPNLSADWKSFLGGTFGVSISAFRTQPKAVGYVNQHHFISSLMADKNLREKSVADYWGVSGGGSATLIGSGSEPFALAKDNLVLWTFDLASLRSTFFLDAAFAVFAYRSLEYVSTAIASGKTYQIGEVVNAASLTLPDGSSLELANRSFQLERPGIHVLRGQTGPGSVIAVDHPRQESEFEPMDYRGLKHVEPLGRNWPEALFHTRLGHDLWKWLLGAALLLVLLEIILVKLEELRPAQTSSSQGGKP